MNKKFQISNSITFSDYTELAQKISNVESEREMYDLIIKSFKNKIGIFEMIILFFDGNWLLNYGLSNDSNTNMIKIAAKFEEDGIILWASEQKSTVIIPNLASYKNEERSFILMDTVFHNDQIPFSILVAIVDRDLDEISPSYLEILKSINILSSIKLKNIYFEEAIDLMGKQTKDLNQKLVESSMLATAGEIAASVARELASPIKIIDANLKLIESGIGSPQRRIEIIRNQLSLIQSLNKRFESVLPSADWEKTDVNICDVIKEVIEITQSQLYEANIKSNIEFERNEFLVNASKNNLEQIFLNLLINAMDAMPDGGEITFGVYRTQSNKIVINIADTGIGIPEENIKRIFEPYFTTKRESRKLGMGLYLTKLLVNKIRGKISFSSVHGKGTTFKIVLPLIKNSAKT